ncbi:hypothetical protein QBC47DRAFT_334305 [Echria macrotheca]|uniref:NACHT domain-containing protein n=1 Tax=Echria macrotheca TaxID=438768 RepID=A0AAJ0FFU8_9PEZI|nr:hypothetical protein QBC47DRAFT_334305 [Echria macrotheca]
MEALAVVALAGNILQFFETGTKFAIRASEICRSQAAGQASTQLSELHHVADDLRGLLEKLQQKPDASNQGQSQLSSLSEACAAVTQEMCAKLDGIGLTGHGRLELVIQEFRASWHIEEIQALETRISRLRDQLAAHLVVSLSRDLTIKSLEKQDEILSKIENLQSYAGACNAVNQKPLTQKPPGSIFIACLARFLPEDDQDDQRQISLLKSAMRRNLAASGTDKETPPSPSKFAPSLEENVRKKFMASLDYRERSYRESAIKHPYQDTFKWIFRDGLWNKRTSFSQWLRSDTSDKSDSNLFWVTGKAGSGKSTLMKFVSDFQEGGEGATECLAYLKKWSGKSKLLTASFYFWASGTAAQASQDSLFRSFLYQVLNQVPAVIPRVAPQVWESACLLGTPISPDWSSEALQRFFRNAMKEVSDAQIKICLFIDGLDEFGGSPEVLISVIRDVLRLPGVKVCVSSRPWVQFEDSFGQGPSLHVQDLTRSDIEHYVKSHFKNDSGFARLCEHDKMSLEPHGFASNLVDEIVKKAAGVFLWVQLVVSSLLSGLESGDRIEDLKNRLDSLPPDIDSLYSRILCDISSPDNCYFKHACQLFRLMLATDGSPDALLFSFADEDVDFAINKLAVRPLTPQQRSAQIQTLRRRLNSRRKGLLEIGKENQVQFLHRTARDFLIKPDTSAKVHEELQGSYFDPHLQLCSAYLCLYKTKTKAWAKEFEGWIQGCLSEASKVTQQSEVMVNILDSLHQTIEASSRPRYLYGRVLARVLEGPERDAFFSHQTRIEFCQSWSGFLALVTYFGIIPYLDARVPQGAICKRVESSNTLTSRFNRLRKWTRGHYNPIPPLLKKGSKEQPSETFPLLFAACLKKKPDIKVFRCLLRHGADPTLRVKLDQFYDAPFDKIPPHIRATETASVLSLIFIYAWWASEIECVYRCRSVWLQIMVSLLRLRSTAEAQSSQAEIRDEVVRVSKLIGFDLRSNWNSIERELKSLFSEMNLGT